MSESEADPPVWLSLGQGHPSKSLLTPDPQKLHKVINVRSVKILGFGVLCYAVV